ncbi:TetR/AcrR family transcriptional regulator [Nocardia goodfellowii]|uniref:AcrR family transcriptional regulator n=1 Tax=Nocardia goodfellowii TaxID=882446 RepID=A0ABS4QBW4_9NOCA|nr:TetR/AcrR family transcriptional regulator [Nocardia goodfellowii]MBP2189196.1 AcrR family transcriptional regulator [Nocardia goodfellowii]
MPSPTTVELLWGIRERPKRGPKPALTLAGIVAEAIALADAEGLASLSMQRLAERLGYTKMSLYRYVPAKEQLTALMLDTALGAPPELLEAQPDSPRPWRECLRQWAVTLFARYNEHPWALDLAVGVRPMGPNELSWLEVALVALEGTGLTGPERLDTVVLINGHIRSLAQQSLGSTGGQLAEQVARQFEEMFAVAGAGYPAVRAAFAEEAAAAHRTGASDNTDDALRFGIGRILDGLAVLIAERAG